MPTRLLSDAQRERYGRYDGPPGRDQIARYFYLDAADREIIARLRGAHNRLGFALQLGTVRFLGVLPGRFDDIPDAVIEAIAAQLDLTMTPSLAAYRTGRPKKRHAAIIRKVYGFQELADDARARFRLTRWLYTLCWSGDDRPSLLIDRATAWMLANKILLPGITTLERLVARIRDRAHRRLWQNLSGALSDAQRRKISALLDREGGSFRTLDALRTAPTKRAMTELMRHFDRIDAIRAYGLAPPSPATVPNALIQRLARVARTMRPSAIAAAKEPRRTAIVAALFHTLEAVAIDDAVELFDALMADVFRDAKAASKRKRMRSLGDLDAAALTLRDLATALAKALCELGKIIKSLHILSFINDEEKRRRILTQLNRQELRHGLARRVCHGERGEIRKPYRQGQEEQLGALGFVLNVVAYWNATYMQTVLDQLEAEGQTIGPEDVARISPLTHRHINFLGRHAFVLPENIAAGELRPLRHPNSEW